ncbi:MAG: ABC transporter ATP-binding protein [Lachnospiraceae bacterium]|nr:ABC transporter ATP-binding protein [Lachnospiraceae bacterium]
MENSKKVLEVKNLSAVYNTEAGVVKAVNDISFTIHEKETLGLVGETGAGKTTTALSIMQLLPEKTGEIKKGSSIMYNGDELIGKSQAEMRLIRGACISMIFQDPMTALNPLMTVGEQIYESLDIHNVNNKSKQELEARVDELLELVGIPAKRKINYPHEFSGGMKQRIVIAIALACEPLLLIADEPTTALDVTIQAQVLNLMRELKEKLSTSMIMITHDLGVVAQTCDKVAVMYAGEIVEYGRIEDIFDREKPHHPYTIGLFDAIPSLVGESTRLKPIDGLMPDPANLPTGCHFNPRCKQCTEGCKKDGEMYIYRDGEHMIRCNLMKGEGK